MPLTAGAHVGPYEILAALGAGGMGEVYCARDTKLRRNVALKILPVVFALDSDRLARFRREAHVLASLNHPNIAAIHGFEDSSNPPALVLELVEGPTLADRIAEGPLPVEEVISIARQICDALEAAHEQGIVHRDLKPANIKVRRDGAVKVLDFGLAKALEPTTIGNGDVTASPTITSPALTRMGVILGTASYMSPEQARGRAADKRSDIWAFGCVLFEMLTGRRLFEGATVSDTLASVLKADPDWTRLPAETPTSIHRLRRRSLEKDRTRRLDSASAARLEIDDALAAPVTDSLPVVTPHRMRALPMALALISCGALGALISWGLTPRAPAADPATRLSVNLEPGVHLGEAARGALYQQRPGLTAVALSPDGRQLVYVGHDGKTSQLYVRHLDRDGAVAIAGTTGAQSPFFSPDGREVGFFIAGPERSDAYGAIIGAGVDANGAIRRVAIAGGPVRTVEISGTAPSLVFPSATWSADDTILLSGEGGIYRVPASGGTIERLIAARGVRFPELLPGGRAILFNAVGPEAAPSLPDIAVETLDTHDRTVLIRGGTFPRFVTSGHLVFARGGKLMAVRFDPVTRTTSGDPVVVGEDVMLSEGGGTYFRENGTAQFAVSRSGNLAYLPGGVYAAPKRALTLVNRKGAATPLPISPANIYGATISPDGKRIAWAQASSLPKTAIWLLDLERGVSRRLIEGVMYLTPVWSPDGTRLAARSRADDGSPVLTVVDVDRGGAPQQRSLAGLDDPLYWAPVYWAPTNHVFLQRVAPAAPGRLATLAMDGASQVRPLLQWSTQMYYPVFSRDGKWMSYSVNETGELEVYVRPVPAGAPIKRVSVNGGTSSAWSADGRELFYREGSRMMAVPISTENVFRTLGPPRELFSGDYLEGQIPSKGFEVTSDGRFLLKTRVPATESAPVTSINVVLNWFEELKRLVPTK
jgi:serine/threonine protein kinase/Tol biopolymer transport system component